MCAAIHELFERDLYLFQSDANERSITSKLAAYLAPKFPLFDVDSEYNRMGPAHIKRLDLRIPEGLGNITSVYPDVIVHGRESQDRNLLVIEVKKAVDRADARSQRAVAFDHLKLRAYKEQLGYSYAMFITFPTEDLADREECALTLH